MSQSTTLEYCVDIQNILFLQKEKYYNTSFLSKNVFCMNIILKVSMDVRFLAAVFLHPLSLSWSMTLALDFKIATDFDVNSHYFLTCWATHPWSSFLIFLIFLHLRSRLDRYFVLKAGTNLWLIDKKHLRSKIPWHSLF